MTIGPYQPLGWETMTKKSFGRKTYQRRDGGLGSIAVLVSYMALIFILSSMPSDAGEVGHLVAVIPSTIQKAGHFLAFGFLAWLWIWTLRAHGVPKRRRMVAAFVLTSAYGALTEFYQILVPGRFPLVTDFLLDLGGTLFFLWLYWKLEPLGTL